MIELFIDRAAAEPMVRAWDEDEPGDAGVLKLLVIEVDTVSN